MATALAYLCSDGHRSSHASLLEEALDAVGSADWETGETLEVCLWREEWAGPQIRTMKLPNPAPVEVCFPFLVIYAQLHVDGVQECCGELSQV